MNQEARSWLAHNFTCAEAGPDRPVRIVTDNTRDICMAPDVFVSKELEDSVWLGTADLSVPGLRVLEDGEGICMLQLPADSVQRETSLNALYTARCGWPVPVHLVAD